MGDSLRWRGGRGGGGGGGVRSITIRSSGAVIVYLIISWEHITLFQALKLWGRGAAKNWRANERRLR